MKSFFQFLGRLFSRVQVKHVRNAGIGTAALTVACLTQWEGMSLTAHHDRIDPPRVITVCIGQTNMDDPTLRAGDKFTKEECEQRLVHDMPRYAAAVDKCIHVAMPPHRTAAMRSFTYNIGSTGLCRSSVARYMNQGSVQKACDALLQYDMANHKHLQGLLNRRRFEREWCLRED